MLKFCPNCYEEAEVRHGLCSNCGEEVRDEEESFEPDTFESEDEWTESDWGQDIEEGR